MYCVWRCVIYFIFRNFLFYDILCYNDINHIILFSEILNGHSKTEMSSFIGNGSTKSGFSFSRKIIAPAVSRQPFRQSANRSTRFGLQCSGIRQSNGERSRASKRRVIKMLFAVVAEFFICWTPMYVIQTWIIYDYDTAKLHVTRNMLVVFNLLGYVSSCCNPITYCFMNRNFRQGFISVFRCSRRRKLRRLKSDTSYSINVSNASRTHICRIPSYDKVNTCSQMETEDM